MAAKHLNLSPEIITFLEQSNFIEAEYSKKALDDAEKAWSYAISRKFNVDTVLGIHKLLMKRLRPDIAGKFRNCDVWIGGQRKKFLHEIKFQEDITEIMNKMTSTELMAKISDTKGHQELPESLKSKTARELHVAFEKIHPFEDGNGRVGRILYNVHRLRMGLPLHVIHTGPEQLAYYQWFNDKKIDI